MCLGVPARVIDTHDDRGTLMATVDFGGASRSVCLAFTPDAEPGTYVIVHAGFAIASVDAVAAEESLKLFEEMGLLDEMSEESEP